jgi:hypothetical protein
MVSSNGYDPPPPPNTHTHTHTQIYIYEHTVKPRKSQMVYTGVEPKHKIKRGQNTMICVMSYKNIKNKFKGAGKKKFVGSGSLPALPISAPGYTILCMHFSNDCIIYSISFA